MNQTPASCEPPPSLWRRAAFAAPAAPLLALTVPPIVFLPPYYSQHLGVPLGAVSAIFLGARALDVLVNPVVGALQDRTPQRWGRRRLWLAALTPALMLACLAAFVWPKPGIEPALLGLAIGFLYLSFAAMMIAHLGWAGEISPDYHGRTRVLSVVQIASTLGQILVLATPAAIAAAGLGGLEAGVPAMGLAIAGLLPLGVGLCLAFAPKPSIVQASSLSVKAAFRALAGSRALRRLLASDFLIGVGQGVTGGLFVFFLQHVLRLGAAAQALTLLYFVAGLIGVPIFSALAQRFNKHRALQAACVWTALGLALTPLAPKGNLIAAAALVALAGLASAAHTMLTRAMAADLVDEEAAHAGAPRAGLTFALLLTVTKLGLALGPLTYAALDAAGFDAKGENSAQALGALAALFAFGPLLAFLGGALALRGYGLDAAAQAALRREIEAKAAGASEPV